jgi:hypothetical protein
MLDDGKTAKLTLLGFGPLLVLLRVICFLVNYVAFPSGAGYRMA